MFASKYKQYRFLSRFVMLQILPLGLLVSPMQVFAQETAVLPVTRGDSCEDLSDYVVKSDNSKTKAEEQSKPKMAPKWDLGITDQKCLSVKKLNLEFSGLQDADVALLVRRYKNLEELDLRGTKLSDEGANELTKLSKLKKLTLAQTNITDFGLRNFRQLKLLRELNLGSTSVTGAGLRSLRRNYHLKDLSVGSTKVSSSDIKSCSKDLPFLTGLSPGDSSWKDSDIQNIAAMKNLRRLDLSGTSISGSGLISLKALKNLKHLSLYSVKFSPEGLEALGTLHQLDRLSANSEIDADGLSKLAHMKNLVNLDWIASLKSDTDRKLPILANWSQHSKLELSKLDLSDSDVSDKGLSALTAIKALKEVSLSNCNVSDDAALVLSKLANMEVLDLSNTHITDKGLANLAACKRLSHLVLRKTAVTDDCVKYLCNFPRLSELCLAETAISNIEALKSLGRLNCLIAYDSNLQDLSADLVNGLSKLSVLNLSNTKCSYKTLENLSSCKSLTELYYEGKLIDNKSKITDTKSINALKKLQQLKKLQLREYYIRAAVYQLKEDLPGCKVTIW